MMQFTIRWIKNIAKFIFSSLDRLIYRNNEFIIISNNCWGAEIYRRLNKPYNTPFVGLFLHGPDYIKLLNDFETYMVQDLKFITESKWTKTTTAYPIGLLGDLEIHFMHYESVDEAREKWNRRTQRMKETSDYNKYFFKICDRDLTTLETIKSFHLLPFKNKISFGVQNINVQDHFQLHLNPIENSVPDGVTLYKLSYKYIDLLKWVNTGVITNNFYTRLKTFLKVN